MTRQMTFESLEQRQLLATGPELVTVLPNAGSFLLDGDLRTEAPSELTLRFSPGQAIDTNTLGGIVITRAGGDGDFEGGRVYSDFGTNGVVTVEFEALRLGAGGNGIQFNFSKSDLGSGTLPTISANLATKIINVTLNSNAATPTTAQGLVDAVNHDANAATLVHASIRTGLETADLGSANARFPDGGSLPLTTGGANAAFGVTNFNVGATPLEVLFTAANAGAGGNGTMVAFRKADLGAAAGPTVSVSAPVTNPASPPTITVTLNTNAGNPTTAQGLVSAINANPLANVHVRASVPIGDPSTDISAPQVVNPVVLGGADDLAAPAGYVARNGNNTNEVIYRFAEPLANDVYRIEVLGAGPGTVLRNQAGDAFNDGLDDRLTFTVDLGPQVTAVVPQPVLRNAVVSVGSVANLRDGDRVLLTAGGTQIVLELDDKDRKSVV